MPKWMTWKNNYLLLFFADISNTDIANYEDIEEKEDMNLAGKAKTNVSANTEEKEVTTPVEQAENEKKSERNC